MTKPPIWFRRRFYPHLDKPVSLNNATEVVTDPKKVSQHAFMPFISFEVVEKRYKPDLNKVEPKKRPLSCCAHMDAAIFSYYSMILSEKYEKKISEYGLSESVLAYRKFPGGKCNIHFANDTFNLIAQRGNSAAVAFDVKGFFDSLDHQALKKIGLTYWD